MQCVASAFYVRVIPASQQINMTELRHCYTCIATVHPVPTVTRFTICQALFGSTSKGQRGEKIIPYVVTVVRVKKKGKKYFKPCGAYKNKTLHCLQQLAKEKATSLPLWRS